MAKVRHTCDEWDQIIRCLQDDLTYRPNGRIEEVDRIRLAQKTQTANSVLVEFSGMSLVRVQLAERVLR